MKREFLIEEEDGKFIVMVVEPIVKPFWKFWGDKTTKSIAKSKKGNVCVYDNEKSAKACLRVLVRQENYAQIS
jgi:hypothetical protein